VLVALKISLTADHDADLPAHIAWANYAEVLNHFNRIDRSLATIVHDREGTKPLTCSSLLGARSDGRSLFVRSGEKYAVRVTGLTPEVSQGLLASLRDSPPAIWRVHGYSFAVAGSVCDAAVDPWTGRSTYEELAAQPVLEGAPSDKVTLAFDSPTAFKSAGHHFPLPLPDLVFGSLAERWNSFSPTVLSPELRSFGHEVIGVSHFQLRSERVATKGDGMVIGGTGRVTYQLFTADRGWLATIGMLANYAVYGGAGVKTAFGMGQLHRVAAGERALHNPRG
jgi:CRISPR-associated endoribonuclease Cas6